MSANSCAIGIDFGSSRFIIAVAKRGGVSIVINEASYRQTPCLVTYGAQRTVGDKAVSSVKRELKNAIFGPTRLIGSLTPELFQIEKQFNFCSMELGSEGNVQVEVNVGGERKKLDAVQVLAGLFSEAIEVLSLNGIKEREVVLSLPAYTSQLSRQVILDAASIVGLKVRKLLHESSAVITDYGIFRRNDLSAEEPRCVAFVDVGYSKTSAFIANIWKDKADILYEAVAPSSGVRNMDIEILNYHISNFEKKTKISIQGALKPKYRLLEAIEKQRKILSSNTEAPINVECLAEDEDYVCNVTREEFEKMIQSTMADIQFVCQDVANFIHEKKNKLHSVERIGGGSRIPIVEQAILSAFKTEFISKTLDASESVSRGCAIQAAVLSPAFKVTPFIVSERILIPISVSLRYEGESPISKQLFAKSSEIGKVLSVGLSKPLPLEVELFSKPNLVSEKEMLVSKYSVPVPKVDEKANKHETKIFFKIDSNGMVVLEKGEVKEHHTSEEDGKEKLRYTELKTTLLGTTSLTSEQMTSFIKDEHAASAAVKKIREDQQAKYQLESFAYSLKDKINGQKYGHLAEPQLKTAILNEVARIENWVYGEGAQSEKAGFEAQLSKIREVSDLLVGRINKIEETAFLLEEASLFFSNFTNSNLQTINLGSEESKKDIQIALNQSNSELQIVGKLTASSSIDFVDSFNYDSHKSKLDSFKISLENILKNILAEDKKKKAEELKAQKAKAEEEAKKKAEEEKKTKAAKETEKKEKTEKAESKEEETPEMEIE